MAKRIEQARVEKALMRRREVEALTTLSRTSIYRKMHDGTFPQAIRLGRRSCVWRAEQISDWIADPLGYRAPEVA